MKLVLGPDNLETELEFQIFKKVNKLYVVHGNLFNIKQLGVFLSGGLDSAALLCLILAEIDNIKENIPVHCFIVYNNKDQVQCAINTLHEVERLFNTQVTYSIEEHHPDANFPNRLGKKTCKYIFDNNPGTIFYQGINNPPSQDIKKFSSVTPIDYGNDAVVKLKNSMVCFPFLFLHKPQIIDIFYKLNCESVIQYTQTCYRACGKCFSCEERAWGFEALNKPFILNTVIGEYYEKN